MNTITIGDTTYNEFEVDNAIGKARAYERCQADNNNTIGAVYNFFKNGSWDEGTVVYSRDDVNTLLRTIGSDIIRSTYYATVLIEAKVTGYVAEDTEDATFCITEDISIDIGSGEVEILSIDAADVWEED